MSKPNDTTGQTVKLDQHYWAERWQQGDTGWHQPDGSPTLRQNWLSLQLVANAVVLVPFCGKTPDMLWLAAQGHHVVGVEVARQAIDEFFDDNRLSFRQWQADDGIHYCADYQQGRIEIVEGDVLALTDDTLKRCQAVYDRGALVAQTLSQRQAYYQAVYGRLAVGCKALLLTVDYPQHQKMGPPFAVGQAEVTHHLGQHWQIVLQSLEDMLPANPGYQQAGVDYAHSLTMLLEKVF